MYRRKLCLQGGHLKRETYFLLLETETNVIGFIISKQKLSEKKTAILWRNRKVYKTS